MRRSTRSALGALVLTVMLAGCASPVVHPAKSGHHHVDISSSPESTPAPVHTAIEGVTTPLPAVLKPLDDATDPDTFETFPKQLQIEWGLWEVGGLRGIRNFETNYYTASKATGKQDPRNLITFSAALNNSPDQIEAFGASMERIAFEPKDQTQREKLVRAFLVDGSHSRLYPVMEQYVAKYSIGMTGSSEGGNQAFAMPTGITVHLIGPNTVQGYATSQAPGTTIDPDVLESVTDFTTGKTVQLWLPL